MILKKYNVFKQLLLIFELRASPRWDTVRDPSVTMDWPMLRERLEDALKSAIKAKDVRKRSTLRLILAAIKDRDISERITDGKDQVGDEDILGILAKMVRQREESLKIYEEAGRLELAEQEREEVVIIESFMPKQMSDEEVQVTCEALIGELGATGLKDMGKMMGALKERYAGKMDFGKANKKVKELLS